ncbi:MAG: hypothetical protein B6245_08140 [Desulfobacteraceae bacterium 4572_88]|nr:MAG: hypothetical protein B6245_08140 [Desulfobacteraceae bacterium 4572_88]
MVILKGEKKMADQEKTADNSKSEQPNVQFHVSPDLEYVYRDVFNVYVGAGDVVIEFGNLHRAMPDHATISNRIVLSVANAYNLHQTLQQALQAAQMQLQRNLQAQGGQTQNAD